MGRPVINLIDKKTGLALYCERTIDPEMTAYIYWCQHVCQEELTGLEYGIWRNTIEIKIF